MAGDHVAGEEALDVGHDSFQRREFQAAAFEGHEGLLSARLFLWKLLQFQFLERSVRSCPLQPPRKTPILSPLTKPIRNPCPRISPTSSSSRPFHPMSNPPLRAL